MPVNGLDHVNIRTTDVVASAQFYVELFDFVFRQGPVVTVTTAVAYPTEMPEVVSSLRRLKEKAATLISHRYKFDDVIQALGTAGTPQSAKVMINFQNGPA